MQPHYHYTTVLGALNDLKKKGFVHDFNLNHDIIVKNPQNYAIEHVYRYEGDSDTDEESIVYGIASISGVKGVFVSGFTTNSEGEVSLIIKKLSLQNNKNFNL
jgi:hypothetical protein